MTAVPSITFSNTGVTLPEETDILSGVLEDINSAFGGGLNVASLETPQGQLATSIAACIADKNAEILSICNNIDPAYADGRWQDAIGRLYGIQRRAATPTTVSCIVRGIVGTIIPASVFAKDDSGNVYYSVGTIEIGSDGQGAGNFVCTIDGPIACPSGTLTKIYQAIPGWDSITNEEDGILGSLAETRFEFEQRRIDTLSVASTSSTQSILSSVLSTTDVVDAYVVDNPSNEIAIIGVSEKEVLPHSVYVCVQGGSDTDVANAIWKKKSAGCGYTGSTEVTVYDDNYETPKPSYIVKFDRPSTLQILFSVTITGDLPANIESLVKTAIVNRFFGLDGTYRERIGVRIFASRFFTAVMNISSSLSLVSILIGVEEATESYIDPGIDEIPSLSSSDINVIII